MFLLKLKSPILTSELPFEFKIFVLVLQVTRLRLRGSSLGHYVSSSAQARFRTNRWTPVVLPFFCPKEQNQLAVSYLWSFCKHNQWKFSLLWPKRQTILSFIKENSIVLD